MVGLEPLQFTPPSDVQRVNKLKTINLFRLRSGWLGHNVHVTDLTAKGRTCLNPK